MKEFNIELAKQGKPVCTRDGKPARIICFDKKDSNYPIVALADNGEKEDIHSLEGRFNKYRKEDERDLMMVGEKKTMWMNIYKSGNKGRTNDGLYQTRESALNSTSINATSINDGSYITTVKVEWEE